MTTRRHPTSCILVPRHGRNHDNHPRRLKSPNHSKFTVLDPFYLRPFAFPFGLPAVPYRRGGTQCPKTDFFHNTFAKSLKQGAAVPPRAHNSDPAGSAQNLTSISPIVLPLNPFQSFVLHGTVADGTTRPNNHRLYPCRSMFGEVKPPTNARPATYHTRTPVTTE